MITPRLWHVKKLDRILGPFPAGAVVADHLVGRIGANDELSPDGDDWRTFDAWPELIALTTDGSVAADAEPQWLGERAKARLRWLDERSGGERRSEQAQGPEKEFRGPE